MPWPPATVTAADAFPLPTGMGTIEAAPRTECVSYAANPSVADQRGLVRAHHTAARTPDTDTGQYLAMLALVRFRYIYGRSHMQLGTLHVDIDTVELTQLPVGPEADRCGQGFSV
jgi:hypothetical protein